MKITKRQLRRLIKEESKKLLYESYMKQRYGEIENAILMALEDSPGLSGMDLVSIIGDQYPENPNETFCLNCLVPFRGTCTFDGKSDKQSL